MQYAERVPETPPNFQPPELEVGLVRDADGDLVSTHILSVYFEIGATQPERQYAIELVGGTVIGGVSSGQDGWYYVEVAGDGTTETIFEIAHSMDALSQVTLASPYIQFRIDPDRDAPANRVEPEERVPATPPNVQPPDLGDDLIPNAHGDLVSTAVLSVQFEVGATQSERQSAIDLVDGAVIGGLSTGQDGWYYVRVEGDGTIETIYEIAHTLDALPQVALAGPFTLFALVPNGDPGASPPIRQ